jgi:hypothetical protein
MMERQRMKRWISWTVAGVAAVVVLVAGAGALGYQMAERKMARKIDVPVKPLAYATEAQAVERGKYLSNRVGAPSATAPTAAGANSSTTARACGLRGPTLLRRA